MKFAKAPKSEYNSEIIKNRVKVLEYGMYGHETAI